MLAQRWPIYVGVGVVVLIFFFSFSEHTDIKAALRPKPAPPPLPVVVPATESKDWEFDLPRDGLNLGLSDQRCTVWLPASAIPSCA